MAINPNKKELIKNLLKKSILVKFQTYKPETQNMPFHYRLLGKDRMYLYSFIQSLNTTFGTSIYEPVALELAKDRFNVALTQVNAYPQISEGAQYTIQSLLDNLTSATRIPNKKEELGLLRQTCNKGVMRPVKLTRIDLWLETFENEIYLMDMKTAKPNIGNFKEYKRTLLEWAASEMARNPDVKIHTLIAIPYNPYEPKPYDRWTLRGLFDLEYEILVGKELWDFLGGENSYDDLLDSFELAGIELRPEIDRYFESFR